MSHATVGAAIIALIFLGLVYAEVRRANRAKEYEAMVAMNNKADSYLARLRREGRHHD